MLGFGKKNKPEVTVTLENPITDTDLKLWEDPVYQKRYQAIQTFSGMARTGMYGFTYAYNGEKDLGGIGPLIDYYVDYEGLRSRSWKAYLDSEMAQTVLGKNTLWMIGSGLKAQCEPVTQVLQKLGIDLNEQDFNDNVEARFQMFCNSERADYSGMKTPHQLASTAHLNSNVGGDVLCILRLTDMQVTIQLIDGAHVQNPIGKNPYIDQLDNGNIIKNGVEIDLTGKHVAYWVRKRGIDSAGTNDMNLNFDSVRIASYSPTSGLCTAFFVNGLEYRIDNVRHIPLLSAVMQTLTSLERYKEATVGSAEEAAKIFLAVEHQLGSEGENPFDSVLRHAGATSVNDKIPIDSDGRQVADRIAVSTGKSAFNMPVGSSLKSFASQKELYFKDFYTGNIECVCAAVKIPYAVAMSKYDTSYSSSRAAIKDWEHTINVTRNRFSKEFYAKIYHFWLDVEILKGNISAPGYLEARVKKDYTVLDAYRCVRFIGAAVPHIDPVKEVEAQRLLLGDTGASIPLTTQEQAVEELNTGESHSITEQYARELENAKKLNIKVEVPPSIVAPVKKDKKKAKSNAQFSESGMQ